MASIDPALLDDGALTVVIVGGGPTGVELSGGLAELFTKVLAKDFKNLDVRRARRRARRDDRPCARHLHPPLVGAGAGAPCGAWGSRCCSDAAVEKVEANAVHLADGRRIPARTLVWAAGVQAAGLGAQLGLEVARGGRVVVDRQTLTVPGHPDVYAIGDVAAAVDEHGTVLPQLAPVAIQAGRHVGRARSWRGWKGRPTRPFHYRDKGTMATIGRNNGIAQLPAHIELWGFPGWLAWLGLHLVLLIGFRNRANVLVNWAWNYLTYDRGARLIVE